MLSLETSKTLVRHRISAWELLPVLALVVVFYAFPDNLTFATAVIVVALFALSLDLVIGFAGIVTLGHSIFFGIGAYSAGLLSRGGYQEPISIVFIAALVAGAFALLTGPFILRLKGLPLIMVTVGLAALAHEAGNKMHWLTGGHDGLPALRFDPILGMFRWSIFGTSSYVYAAVWLVLVFIVVRVIVSSSFGVSLQGIRQNELRMKVLGAPVLSQLVVAYAISAAIAGIAGALYAQTNGFVGLETVSVDQGVFALVMIVLGGIGRLYGALLGAVVYMYVQYAAQQLDPYYWMFAIGILLVLVVRFSKDGLLGLLERARDRVFAGSETAK